MATRNVIAQLLLDGSGDAWWSGFGIEKVVKNSTGVYLVYLQERGQEETMPLVFDARKTGSDLAMITVTPATDPDGVRYFRVKGALVGQGEPVPTDVSIWLTVYDSVGYGESDIVDEIPPPPDFPVIVSATGSNSGPVGTVVVVFDDDVTAYAASLTVVANWLVHCYAPSGDWMPDSVMILGNTVTISNSTTPLVEALSYVEFVPWSTQFDFTPGA